MRFTSGVDIAEELIASALDGSLVLFVGAGVSRNDPSTLSLFGGLVSQVAELHGSTPARYQISLFATSARLATHGVPLRVRIG